MNLITNSDLLNNLYRTQKKIDAVTAQLSTGLRVNKAADDPSSIVYSTRLTSKINETETHLDGIEKAQFILESMQVGFASLKKVAIEIEKLAQTATNPTLSESEIQVMQEEYTKLISTYDYISQNFEVNSVNYLFSDEATFSVNAGYERIGIVGAGVGRNQSEGITYPPNILDVPTGGTLHSNANALTNLQSKYAIIQTSLTRYEELNMTQLEIMKKDYSRITDADTAKATSELARLQILEDNNLMLMQVNDSRNQMLSNLLDI